MLDDRVGDVADGPVLADQAPHEVDILSDAQGGVEAADRAQRRGAPDESCGRDEGHAPTGCDERRLRSEVERRATHLVVRDGGGAWETGHAGSNESEPWVVEQVHELVGPA